MAAVLDAQSLLLQEPLLVVEGQHELHVAELPESHSGYESTAQSSTATDDEGPDASQPQGPQLAAQGESLTTEACRVLPLALPAMASEMLTFCSFLITTAQVGRLGAAELSSFTLARTMYHITGLSLIAGLTSGSDTFSGQAYGAQQYAQLGINMQRALIMNLLLVITILIVWSCGASSLMLLLGQQPSIVEAASPLLLYMAPAMLLWSCQVPIHGYLAVQGVVLPRTMVAVAGIIITMLANIIFMNKLGYGLTGVAYAYDMLAGLETVAFIGCMIWLHGRQPAGCKTWSGFRVKAALSGWPAYLQIALPSLGMICLDWWSFEVMILVAGVQPDAEKQQGAMGILFATHTLAYMVSSGYGQAAATRVSNELGAGHGAAAQRATITATLLSFCCGCCVAGLLMACRQPWAQIYSQDEEVIHAVVASMPFLCLSVVSDSVNVVLSAVLRGCGHQLIGFVVNLIILWGVGLSTAYYLDLKLGFGTTGVWIALAGTSFLHACVLTVSICCFNWSTLATRAQQLVALGHRPSVCEPSLDAAHA